MSIGSAFSGSGSDDYDESWSENDGEESANESDSEDNVD